MKMHGKKNKQKKSIHLYSVCHLTLRDRSIPALLAGSRVGLMIYWTFGSTNVSCSQRQLNHQPVA